MLYSAVFAANRLYGLIDWQVSLLLAGCVTAAAMIYALALNEIVIAFLSLLGGFLAPMIVTTRQNLPAPVFCYATVLAVGAMSCAFYRKWRAINVLAFIGTFVLYIRWFEHFYRPTIAQAGQAPQQLTIALVWLGVFSGLYLLMPIVHELARRVRARKDDVLLVLANAAVTFYYLWTMLFADYRTELALCAVALGAIHLVVMGVVIRRCRDDVDMQVSLLAIGLFFITIAVPLYLKMYAIALAWAIQALILPVIRLRYRSIWTQLGAAIVFFLSIGQLLHRLPMHNQAFTLVLNPAFGTWCSVAAAACAYHLIYRYTSQLKDPYPDTIAQISYSVMGILLFTAATMEWYWHCHYNLQVAAEMHYISKGQLMIFAGILLLFTVRPLCPRGAVSEFFSFLLIAAGSIFTIVALMNLHTEHFTIFANPDFLLVIVFITATLFCHIRYRLISEIEHDRHGLSSQIVYGILGLLLLAAITAEWYWHCVYNLSVGLTAPMMLKGQVIIFAAVMLFFLVRPICPTGVIPRILAVILGLIGAIFTMITFPRFYNESFIIFANNGFMIVLLFVASLFLGAWLLRQLQQQPRCNPKLAVAFVLAAILVLWVLLTEETYLYWYCRNRFAGPLANWLFLAHMYISVLWAVYAAILMVMGF